MGQATPGDRTIQGFKAPANTPSSPALDVADAHPRGSSADQQRASPSSDVGSVSLRARGATAASPASAQVGDGRVGFGEGGHGYRWNGLSKRWAHAAGLRVLAGDWLAGCLGFVAQLKDTHTGVHKFTWVRGHLTAEGPSCTTQDPMVPHEAYPHAA